MQCVGMTRRGGQNLSASLFGIAKSSGLEKTNGLAEGVDERGHEVISLKIATS